MLLTHFLHSYVVSQWACWLAELCVVPLHKDLPVSLIKYYVKDSAASMVIVTEELRHKVDELLPEKRLIIIPEEMQEEDPKHTKLQVLFSSH